MIGHQMIPLHNPRAVFEAWPTIVAGMERVLDFSGEDDDLANTLNRILSGELLLWIGFRDGVYCGFLTTQTCVIGTNPPRKIIWIQHAYKPTGVDGLAVYEPFFDVLRQFARDNGCSAIKFSSRRKGMERVLSGHGFKPTYTEYEMEVGHGW